MGRQMKCEGGILSFQLSHSSCPDPNTTIRKFFSVSGLSPTYFKLSHSSLPGMGEADSISFLFSNLPPLPLAFIPPPGASFPFLRAPRPISNQTFFLPRRWPEPGPPTFLALISMLVWVGADVAGDALVVWEAEAGPVALDPITALRSEQEAGSFMGKGLYVPSPNTPSFHGLALSFCYP